MKRIAIVGTCLLAMTAGVSAQTALLKTSKQALNGAKDYAAYTAAIETLTPAFTNPETANSAETYFIPGEAGFKLYDNYLLQRQIGGPDAVNANDMGAAIMDGYRYFMKAFTLDSLPNEKGQVKPKYSKKMIDMIAGHVNDFDQAAVGFWQVHNFPAAYDAWDACLAVSEDPRYAKTGIKARPDSVIAQIRYNQALAAWQGNMLDKAIKSFDQALALGNNDPQAYEYAYSVAYQAKDSVHMAHYAAEGLKRFGSQDPKFLQWTVNGYIESKQYDKAVKLLNEAIESYPDVAEYRLSNGVLNESMGNREEAIANYKKGIELKPDNANAYTNLGRVIAEQYDALDEKTGDMSTAEYDKYNNEVLIPMLKESAACFEKAYELDNDNTTPLKYLKNIYYRLDDGDNLKRVEDLLKY